MHVVKDSRRAFPFNTWAVNVLKGRTRAIMSLYCVKEINRGYNLKMTKSAKNQALKAK